MLAALALPAHGQQAPVNPQTLPVKHKLTAAPKVIISTIPDVIRTPEGQRHDNCIRAAHGFYDSYYDLNEYDNTEAVGSYVTGSDGTVYMLNPISYMVSNTYMKLDPYNGDTLVARLPQIVVAESYGNSFVAKMKQNGQDNWTLNADQNMYFVLRNDTLKALDDTRETPLGFIDESESWYAVEYGHVFTKNPYKAVTVPEGARDQKYSLNRRLVVSARLTDDALFINDPSTPGLWLKGTKDAEGNYHFAAKEYMGVNERFISHQFQMPASYVVKSDEYGNYNDYTYMDELVMRPSGTDGMLTSVGNVSLLSSLSTTKINPVGIIDNPVLIPYNEVAAEPVAPKIEKVGRYIEDYGAEIIFTMELESTDGKFIDPDKLFYEVYVDDNTEPIRFVPEEEGGPYHRLDSAMTQVPYAYSDNNYDFIFNYGQVKFYIYDSEMQKVGIRTVYKGGGEEHASPIVWQPTPASITGVGADSQTRTEYTTLSGMRVEKPAKGINIRKVTDANGNVKVEKILVK